MLHRKRWAILLSTAMVASLMPVQPLMAATENATLVYQNDFNNSEDEDVKTLSGNDKAYCQHISGYAGSTTTDAVLSGNWEVVVEKEYQTSYDQKLYKGTTLSYEILIPDDQTFEGYLKAQAVVKIGPDSKWTQCNDDKIVALTAADFKERGDGFKSVTVHIPFDSNIEAEEGLQAVIPRIAASKCNYIGDLYIDNIELVNGTEETKDQTGTGKELFYEDFENDTQAEQIGNTKALRFYASGDRENERQNIFEKELNIDPAIKELKERSVVSFDILVPEDADFNGTFKGYAAIKDQKNRQMQANVYQTYQVSDFKSTGDGYKKVSVTIQFDEAVNGVCQVIPGLLFDHCDYTGDVYLDNVKLANAQEDDQKPLPPAAPLCFTFDTDINGWVDEGGWNYSGAKTLNHTTEVGDGALAIALDYTADSKKDWSEAKVKYNFDEPKNTSGYTSFTCDFIYDPACMTQGSFKLKVFAGTTINKDVDVPEGVDYGNGLKKSSVTIKLSGAADEISDLTIGIVGYKTDYKGVVYLDNITLGQKNNEDVYVLATKTPAVQEPVQVSDNQITANGMAQRTLKEVKLVDDQATNSTASLYAYLEAIGRTDSVLFGHQNDTHHKVGDKSLSSSDVKDVVGSISAIVGLDTLSLTGNEFPGDRKEYSEDLSNEERVSAFAQMTQEAANEGAILTLSAHLPNFAIMAKRTENQPDAQGQLDWKTANFYSNGNNEDGAWVTGGDVVSKIMPGGELNYCYNAYLDMIAAYAHEMGDTPIMFRPLHENTGTWFWWGASGCDAEAYKNLYRYTVEYLRDQKGVHNFLYIYSPGSEAESEAEFEVRYPGDDYVDMVGFDMYHSKPSEGDSFINDLKTELNIVDRFATTHDKLVAVTETGVSNDNGALLVSGNQRKNWYNEVLDAIADSHASYFMVWSNFGEGSIYVPYVVEQKQDSKRGHEMMDDFIDFYNDGRSVFAAEVGNVNAIQTQVKENKDVTGYITSPVSGSDLNSQVTVEAKTRNVKPGDTIQIVAANKEGTIKVNSTGVLLEDGKVQAEFTTAQIQELGATIGSMSLVINGETYSTIRIQFNLQEQVVGKEIVDDFETYYGDDDTLNTAWSPNKGTGCAIKPALTDKKYTGRYGLSFHYTLKGAGGYAGITKNMNNDWSDYNALQLWTVPDGKNQKIVIQIVSAGKTFEVYLNDYEAYRDRTTPVLVTIPFSAFVGRDNDQDVFDPSKIESFGLYCNAVVPKDESGANYILTSTIYYDGIRAVQSDASQVTITNVSGGNSSGGSSSGSSSSGHSSSSSSGTQTSTSSEGQQIEAAIKENKTAEIKMTQDTVQIKEENYKALFNSNNALHLNANKVTLTLDAAFAQNNLQLDKASAGDLQITLKQAPDTVYNELSQQLADHKQYTLVGSQEHTFVVDVKQNNTAIHFTEPLQVKIDLSQITVKEPAQLTLVQYVQQGDGTFTLQKLGGTYNEKDQTFEARVEEGGSYALVEADNLTKLELTLNNKNIVNQNGETMEMNVAPKVVKGATMLPLRSVAEVLGYQVKWNGAKKQVTLDNGEKDVTLQIGKTQDGQEVAPFIENGSTLVPVRYIAEQLDAHVLWVPSTKTIEIVK